jgi:hypothetical protein
LIVRHQTTIVITVALIVFSMVALASQSRDGKSSSTIPRLPGGRPDLNGVWDHPFVQNMEMDGRDQKGEGHIK